MHVVGEVLGRLIAPAAALLQRPPPAPVPPAQDWLRRPFATAGPYEGMKAFVEKRPVDYIALRQKAVDGRAPEFIWGAHTQSCAQCDAKGIPADFEFCGKCGTKLA